MTRRPQCVHVALALVLAGALSACASQQQNEKSQSSDTAATYNVQLGVAYLQQGNLPVAKEKLERAYKQNPRDPNVHSGLALLYARLGEPAKADDHYRTALRLAPRNPEVLNNYAVYLCKNNRVEEGVRRFLDAARNPLYSTPEAAYTNAGVCLRAVQRDDEAEKHFLSALEIRPNHAEAAFQLGDLYFQRGRLQEARTRLERYLGAFSPTPELLFLAVRVARATGDRLAAERYARRLRLDFPQSEQTRALTEFNPNPG